MSTETTLTGEVSRIRFENETNGFRIAMVRLSNPIPTSVLVAELAFVGNYPRVCIGDSVSATGKFKNDPKYGPQLVVDHLEVVTPPTLDGMIKFLSSGRFPGIGPAKARRIVEAFKETTADVIENRPRELVWAGLTHEQAETLSKTWADESAMNKALAKMVSLGLTAGLAQRIYRKYGADTETVIRERPYSLARELERVGFKIADSIALKVGISVQSAARASAAIQHVMEALASDGHTVSPRGKVTMLAGRLLDPLIEETDTKAVPSKVFVNLALEAIERGIEHDDLRVEPEGIAAPRFADSEDDIAAMLVGRMNGTLGVLAVEPPWEPPMAVDFAVLEAETGIHLSPSQRTAVETIITSNVAVLTGGPGVGKTTVVKSLLSVFESAGLRVTLCAPTGRASKRMSEVTGKDAKTIHRTLEFKGGAFMRNERNPLDCDVVIVDEFSMVDVALCRSLLQAVGHDTRLVIVGDSDQLPSVGAGSVLRDIIASGAIPTVKLTEVHRQAQTSQIVVGAHAIIRGAMPKRTTRLEEIEAAFADSEDAEPVMPDGKFIVCEEDPAVIPGIVMQLASTLLPRYFGLDPMRDIQVLVPMRKGEVGTENLNRVLQNAVNRDGRARGAIKFGDIEYRVGDRVMQTKNDYDREIYNGDVGFVSAVGKNGAGDPSVTFRLEDKDGAREVEATGSDQLGALTHAYASTVHKSQGSEYRAVIVCLVEGHYKLLARSIFYTAVTRARELMVLVGTKRAMQLAVRDVGKEERRTTLERRLREKGAS